MTRRKRVPLQLKGSDEKYFRTREIQTRPDPDPEPETPPKAETPAKPNPKPPAGQGARKAKPRKQSLKSTPPRSKSGPESGEVVSRIVPLGRALSTELQDLAERLGVPVDDLLHAARKRAVARVRGQLAGAAKPELPEVIKGGETIRIAFKLTPEELASLNGWFDPLGLGLTTKPLAPLLAGALRAEVSAMCRAAR